MLDQHHDNTAIPISQGDQFDVQLQISSSLIWNPMAMAMTRSSRRRMTRKIMEKEDSSFHLVEGYRLRYEESIEPSSRRNIQIELNPIALWEQHPIVL